MVSRSDTTQAINDGPRTNVGTRRYLRVNPAGAILVRAGKPFWLYGLGCVGSRSVHVMDISTHGMKVRIPDALSIEEDDLIAVSIKAVDPSVGGTEAVEGKRPARIGCYGVVLNSPRSSGQEARVFFYFPDMQERAHLRDMIESMAGGHVA